MPTAPLIEFQFDQTWPTPPPATGSVFMTPMKVQQPLILLLMVMALLMGVDYRV